MANAQIEAVEAGIDYLWYTRCNVPTASGIAYNSGWLAERYAADGVSIGVLQEAPLDIARHHYDHLLPGLIREGGNVPALVARSNGSPTRLIGLTWIDERQVIAVRADSGIASAADLAGKRIAAPSWSEKKESSMARAMALHGFENALALAGLGLRDMTLVEIPLGDVVPPGRHREERKTDAWPGIRLVADGAADAVYLKGAGAARAAAEAGLVVAVNLDAIPNRRARVNNGTPRPLTVHQKLLDERPDWVVAFLAQTLRAAEWAIANPVAVRDVVARETQSTLAKVIDAYGPDFHRGLHPDLSKERIDLLGVQKDFLLRHQFMTSDFDLADWIAAEPLETARRLIAEH
jgi:ABC-type nitrate/sulfonate/bicarbonate transport system substrate-binding protein